MQLSRVRVERVGDTVRINAELVDTRSERYLWAETFNRRLDEILQVQDDVAEAIAFHAKLFALAVSKCRIRNNQDQTCGVRGPTFEAATT